MASERLNYTGVPGEAGWIPSGTGVEVEPNSAGNRQVVAVRNPDDGTSLDVDVTTSALPTGAATSAKQDTLLSELQLKADLTETQPATLKDSLGNSSHDASTGAIMTVDYEHHEVHSGDHYFVRGYQDLSINEVLDFTWLMPDTTKWIHWTWSIEVESETNWLVYENVVATNPLANTFTPRNSNRNSGNTSGTTMRYELQASLAAANADTNVGGAAILLESGITGSGRNAGQTLRGNEMIMKQNTLYCLRAIATAAGFINFTMDWYEHTNKV